MGFHFLVSRDHQHRSSWFLEGGPCAVDPLMDLWRRKWTVPPIPLTLWDLHHDPGRSILLTEILLLFSHKAMSYSLWTLGLHTRAFCPLHHPGSAWNHIHWMGEAIQPSPSFSPMSPPAPNFPVSAHADVFLLPLAAGLACCAVKQEPKHRGDVLSHTEAAILNRITNAANVKSSQEVCSKMHFLTFPTEEKE